LERIDRAGSSGDRPVSTSFFPQLRPYLLKVGTATAVWWLLYESRQVTVRRLEKEKRQGAEMADLHMRTIEALALAIDAKDDTTHEHLHRVKVYATEVGKELGCTGAEMQALEAAALLHDIGKLAVPEYIISKPGKLSPEEFEQMKIHPAVGAEILERVRFPYPVAPMVRSHHECWDGSGYPDGLKGEEIPLGARILAVVDCFEALAPDRQYRRAYPLRQALEMVRLQGGTRFDPQVVDVLTSHYAEFEQLARATPVMRLSAASRVPRGEGHAGAGYEVLAVTPRTEYTAVFVRSLRRARNFTRWWTS
jgi:putative nucleotidyltransferase with HDIG domain